MLSFTVRYMSKNFVGNSKDGPIVDFENLTPSYPHIGATIVLTRARYYILRTIPLTAQPAMRSRDSSCAARSAARRSMSAVPSGQCAA